MKAFVAFLAWFGASALALAPAPRADTRPNFVVILTDDQDQQLDSLQYMKGVKTYLTQQGTIFPRHYCTVSVCCPSRTNLWTGKAAHNTNVTDLQPPYGGYPKFIHQGWQTKWLPTWLQNAGYQTYFTGKLMNSHTIQNYAAQVDHMSLTGYDFMLEPGTYQYLNTTLVHTGGTPISYPGEYATDLLANRSLDLIEAAASQDAPFFIAINPVNPHANLNWSTGLLGPPVAAPRYQNLFPDVVVPRGESFNPDVPSGASWIRALPVLTDTQIAQGDEHYRLRLRALQAVDDLVNNTIARLDALGILDNTFVIFTSDNGFHISQHRLPSGKRCPYEEDVNVPLIIRGPGVPKGHTTNSVTSHTDITPSIVHWAGATADIEFDGSPLPIPGVTTATRDFFEHAQMEFWGIARDDLPAAGQPTINGYKAIRVIGLDYNLFYSVWCDHSHEVYDMTNDPLQMKNLYNVSTRVLGASIENLQNRLDALTLVLKTCAAQTCQDPWLALHPGGRVHTIRDALNPEFDQFYKAQPKVSFDDCPAGYFLNQEQPTQYNTFSGYSAGNRRHVDDNDDYLKWWEIAG